MTPCDRITPLLSLYLEGETSPAETGQIRTHLKACAECRGEYGEMKATVELVRGLPRSAAPDDFEARVMARLKAVAPGSAVGRSESGAGWESEEFLPADRRGAIILDGGWDEPRWWEAWVPRFAAAAAAAAIVAVAMYGRSEFLQHQDGRTPEMASTTTAMAARAVPSVPNSGLGSSSTNPGALNTETASLESSAAAHNPQFDDLRSLFPDIPAEVILAMPLNGETYASDRMVAQPWPGQDGPQMLAPVDFNGGEKVYIYR